MRVAVVGLGGVGGYICASLAKVSTDVVGFARGEHLEKIKQDGITIVEDEMSWTQPVDVKELSEASGYFDLVIFCVKSYDLVDSYKLIEGYCDNQTVMFSLSNGVSNGDTLRELSNSVVLDACVYILSHIEKSGVIRKKGKVFALVFGGDESSTCRVDEIVKTANLRTKTPQDIKTAIWKKYIFISAFGTLTSYYDKSIGYIYEHHKYESEEVLKEISDVARALHVELESEIQKALDTASRVPYDSTTSMYLDFKNKKRDELKTLSGYIVEKAETLHVEVPYMKKMYEELLKRHID